MKSKKAKEFIDGCLNHLVIEMSDHAKWQLRAAMSHTAELAEQEAEERMRVGSIACGKISTPNYSSWLSGCPRMSEEQITRLEELQRDIRKAERELEEQIRKEKF